MLQDSTKQLQSERDDILARLQDDTLTKNEYRLLESELNAITRELHELRKIEIRFQALRLIRES